MICKQQKPFAILPGPQELQPLSAERGARRVPVALSKTSVQINEKQQVKEQ